jgi:succinate dehydrogenase hydrophobic anchor subunit
VLLDAMERNFSVCIYFYQPFSKIFGLIHALIATTHGWVNVDFMLDACLVGFLVSEPPIGSAEDE